MDCFCGEYRAHTVSYMYMCCGLASVGRGSRATFSLAPHWNHYHYSGLLAAGALITVLGALDSCLVSSGAGATVSVSQI